MAKATHCTQCSQFVRPGDVRYSNHLPFCSFACIMVRQATHLDRPAQNAAGQTLPEYEAARADRRAEVREFTVKRATLFDGVQETYQTEAEVNGHRATQGRMI